jgi:pimeloyl-ACP methyl ester carboxylesterase
MIDARTIEIGGASVRFRDSGGSAMPVLLTHGIGGSLELWNRQFEPPDPGMRTIAWDMPSHGLSGAVPDDTDLDGIARQAWRLLGALGVDKAVLVGNSLGAAVSLRMAAQAPDRVLGLVLASAATLGPDVMLPFRLMTVPGLGEVMTKPGPKSVQLQIKSIVRHARSVTPDVQAAIERNVMRPGGATHFLALLRALTGFGGQRAAIWQRSHEILGGLQVPVLFVHGEHDAVVPVAHSRQAHARLPGSELVVMADCGHTPQLEQPEAFNRLLGSLARRVSA